jgi:hypothetical protein
VWVYQDALEIPLRNRTHSLSHHLLTIDPLPNTLSSVPSIALHCCAAAARLNIDTATSTKITSSLAAPYI